MKDVMISRSDEGEVSIYDRRDKFMASFRDGTWVADTIFESYELEEFTILEDDSEILRILNEARSALHRPLQTK